MRPTSEEDLHGGVCHRSLTPLPPPLPGRGYRQEPPSDPRLAPEVQPDAAILLPHLEVTARPLSENEKNEWKSPCPMRVAVTSLLLTTPPPSSTPDSSGFWLIPLSWPGPRRVAWSQQGKDRLIIPFLEKVQIMFPVLGSDSNTKVTGISLIQGQL